MKNNVFTIRLAPALTAQVCRDAARRRISPPSWAAHLIERGQLADSLERFFSDEAPQFGKGPPGMAAIPPQAMERLLFAACFSEAILKKLNASLNRSTSELGTIAAQARDQALAETAALLKTGGS